MGNVSEFQKGLCTRHHETCPFDKNVNVSVFEDKTYEVSFYQHLWNTIHTVNFSQLFGGFVCQHICSQYEGESP